LKLKWVVLAGVGLVLTLFATVVLMFSPGQDGPEASASARGDIPTGMLELYQQAATICPGLSWTILAAIGKVETDHARNVHTSSAGAEGPMQFMPRTWNSYRVDSDGDGKADVQGVPDAVHSAANYLCANGAGDAATLDEAIFRYNHSYEYVLKVREIADSYALSPTVGGTVADVLGNPRIALTRNAIRDLEQGLVDARVVALLAEIGKQHEIAISVLKTGHSRCVDAIEYAGCPVSNHYLGRAADIYKVDGKPVTSSNEAARELALWLNSVEKTYHPTEIGSPFSDLTAGPLFTDEYHTDHIHLGFTNT
jgi:hypothetical protein